MRVVLAANITVRGGVWRHLVDLAGGLHGTGCDVTLALPPDAWQLADEARGLGLVVHGLSPAPATEIWHLHLADTFDRRMLPALVAARRRAGAVIVTEHLPRSDASDPSASVGETRRHAGAWPTKTVFKRAEFALCRRVICVSQASRRFLLLRYGVDPEKVVAVPNGIAATGPVVAWPEGPTTFVAIGAVIVQKGFDVLIEAAARARQPWEVVVLGEGAHLATLRAEAAERSLPVRFTGSSLDVRPALAASSGLVVPSRWEASSYVSMEAMELGRPVVASRVDSLPELVADGATGLLVSPEDPDELAGALDRLAADPALAEELGRAGRKRVEAFGLDQMVMRIHDVYSSALGSRTAPGPGTA